MQHSKSILSRLISKFNQLCIIAKSNAGALRPFDVNQTAILIEMSRDAIHYLIRMCVGFFLRLVCSSCFLENEGYLLTTVQDPCIEDFCRESLLNVSSELENGNAFPWNVTKTDLPPRKPLSVTASSRATTVGDCGRRTAPQKDTLRRGDPFKCYRSKEEEDCLSTDMLSEIDGEKDLLNNISLDGKGRDKATLDRISRLLRGVSVEKSKRRPTILIGDTIHSGDSCNDSSVSPLPAWALPKVFANEIRELTFSKRQLC